MKNTYISRIMAFLLALVMCASVLPLGAFAAEGEETVKYVAYDTALKSWKLHTAENPTALASSDAAAELAEGFYVVDGRVNLTDVVTVKGNVSLIIKNGGSLRVFQMDLAEGASLTVYGQTTNESEPSANGSGRLLVGSSVNGGSLTAHGVDMTGNDFNVNALTVYGGSLNAGTIKAEAAKTFADCEVYEAGRQIFPEGINVTDVSLDQETLEMVEGEEKTLTAVITPDDAMNKGVTWVSNDPSVATVDQDGVVTAIAEGTAAITVCTKDGSKTSACEVTVSKAPETAVTGVTLSGEKLAEGVVTLGKDEQTTLTATVNPEGATNVSSIAWATSDGNVVTVVDGQVTAVSVGEATVIVTVTDSDGVEFTAACKVLVPEVFAKGITLDTGALSMHLNDTYDLKATVTPANATDKTVTWSSDNPDVATVDENGRVTALAQGAAVITAEVKTEDGVATATCSVQVKIPSSVTLAVTKDGEAVTEITAGDKVTLTATVAPAGAGKVEFKAGEKLLGEVDTVEGVAVMEISLADVGGVTVTATFLGSDTLLASSATASLTVKPVSVTGITLDQTELTLENGSEGQMNAVVAPENATDKTVTWTCDNEAVATVDQNGLVTAMGVGKAVITAAHGEFTATCTVTVTPKTYTVEFVTDCDITVDPQYITEGGKVTKPADPTNGTKTFAGWYVDEETPWDFENAVVNHDMILMAKWVETPVEGISLDKSKMQLTVGGVETLFATVTPENAYEKLVLWTSDNEAVATVENGKVTAVAAGTATITATTKDGGFTAACTVTVEAPEVIYTVTVTAGKGGSVRGGGDYGKGAQVSLTAVPESGYRFLRWEDASGDTFTNNPLVFNASANRTLKAVFQQVFTVNFETGSGSKVESQSVPEGGKATKPADPLRPGYVFSGWYSEPACENLYDFGKAVNSNLSLYAKWTPEEVKVETHEVQFKTGCSIKVATQTVKHGEKAASPTPVRSGYAFKGWYTDEKCTKKYSFDVGVNEDLILYAKWVKLNELSLTYDANAGKDTVTKMPGEQWAEVEEDHVTFRIPATKPKRSGYSFKGWNTRADGKGTMLKPGQNLVVDDDNNPETLYAVWKKADLTNSKTGDIILAWVAVLAVSGAGLAAAFFYLKKKKNK